MKKNDMIFHFGKKALNDAIRTGKNQIFLSVSVAESEAINACVARLAKREGFVFKEENPIALPNGATLSFLLASNRVTAGHCGNVYVINCFNEANFTDISGIAHSWALHKKYRVVFYSEE